MALAALPTWPALAASITSGSCGARVVSANSDAVVNSSHRNAGAVSVGVILVTASLSC